MKHFLKFFIFLAIATFGFQCIAETTDLDLIILQNPKAELKKAAKKGQLEKLLRIIRLIDQRKINPEIFQDPSLMSKAEKREIKNNRYSKVYLGFRGFLWTSLIGTALIPAGAEKSAFSDLLFSEFGGLDPFPVTIKGIFLLMELWFLHLSSSVKELLKRDGRLVNQLVKKYHEKSLAVEGE